MRIELTHVASRAITQKSLLGSKKGLLNRLRSGRDYNFKILLDFIRLENALIHNVEAFFGKVGYEEIRWDTVDLSPIVSQLGFFEQIELTLSVSPNVPDSY